MRLRDVSRRLLAGLTVLVVSAGCTGASLTPAPTPTPGPTPTAAVSAIAASPTSTPAPASLAPTIGVPADDGARIIAVESPTMLAHRAWVDPGAAGCPADSSPGCWVNIGSPMPTTRARDLTIDSPAVGIVHARLLLPGKFEAQPSTRWPVLYLHHGGDTDYTYWTEALDVVTLTAPTDVLVAMPDGETGPNWETFHLVELRQLLERNWQAGDRRAVAGISMGGAEAMAEAESQPGMFRFAGSYSGSLDAYGNLAALKGTALYVAYGNGQLGPLDNGQVSPYDESGSFESSDAAQGAAFVQRLAELKIPVTVYAYGNGTHNVPYWQRDFERSFPLILKALGL
jgi:S-formylglutathione hydrolase FrmB